MLSEISTSTESTTRALQDAPSGGSILDRLDRLIAALESGKGRVPVDPDDVLWTAEDIAKWLGKIQPDTVKRYVVTQESFPEPFAITTAKQGQKRWFMNEVIEWARTHRTT